MSDRTEAEKQNEARGREVAARTGVRVNQSGLALETDPMVFVRERSITEVTSSAFDKARQFVGSSAFKNDASSTAVTVPTDPSALDNPYLWQMCGIALSSYEACRIRGLRTYVGLAAEIPQFNEQQQLIGQYTATFQVTSPLWSYSDGFVSFHLRMNRGPARANPATNTQRPNETNTIGNTGTALIYRGPSATPYSHGAMIGDPVGSLGTVRDNRFPWWAQNAGDGIDYVVEGPGVLMVYMACKQTDPATRSKLILPPGFDLGSLLPEDRWTYALDQIQTVRGTRYDKIACSLVAEIGSIERRPGLSRVTGETPS